MNKFKRQKTLTCITLSSKFTVFGKYFTPSTLTLTAATASRLQISRYFGKHEEFISIKNSGVRSNFPRENTR
jgi:hypothetical protein